MANNALGFTDMGICNSLKTVPGNTSGIVTPTNYASVNALRTRLAAVNGTYYTSALLDVLSVNDMVFALRSIDDKTTICDYMPTSTA